MQTAAAWTAETAKQSARQEGYDANLAGALSHNNPHPAGPLHKAWVNGFAAAQRDLRDAFEADTHDRAVMFGD